MRDEEKLEQIALLTFELYADARTMVPEHGNEFKVVYSRLHVEDWGYNLTDIVLAIEPVPKCIPDREDDRYIVLAAYRLPLEYKLSRILKVGSKQELMECLQCKELQERILAALPQMAENLDDL